MTDQEIIDQISVVRARNNINWMQILRVALKHAPEETKIELAAIYTADNEVADLVRMLAYPAMKI